MKRPLPLHRLSGLAFATGLTAAEAQRRRVEYGANDIVEAPPRAWLQLACNTARDPMLWFLAVTSGLYLGLGQRGEGVVLIAALIPLVGMDAFLHRRTAASTEGLSARLASRATVERDGALTEVAASELVPGDLVRVKAGEWFPADGVIVAGSELQSDESSLTGESLPVAKRPLPNLPSGDAEPLVAGEHWGCAGTRLLTGTARLRVVWTGAQTLYGDIVRSALQGSGARTPLQAAIATLVGVLVAGAAVMCLILAYVRLRQGYGWMDAFLSAVTLAVAAIPEEFPVVFTFFLGVGVYRLAKRQALVRRAVSVENIGRVSCICSDKTGTITEGQLQLTHVVPIAGLDAQQLLLLARSASRQDSGDPLDEAIARAATELPPQAVERVAVFPFTESRKRETVVLRQADGALVAATKGAGELVLALAHLTEAERTAWRERMVEYAAAGHKVIGCAWRPLDAAWAGGEPDRGFRWAGFLALEDPVRAGVPEAIRECRAAGLHIVMVTGDHPATATTIAREIGLGADPPRVLSGDEIDALLERGDTASLAHVDVIARAVPAQKLGLVRALQAAGEIVAVTGDGVNDVPALQAADIGIAMGQRGTRSAREVAAIVLLDDNFRSIVGAVAEGQQLFVNLRLSFQYLLMIHLPLVITAALIPLAGFPLLYLPVHVVWLELIIHPSALLVFQERGAARRVAPTRDRRRAHFFTFADWVVIGGSAALITLVVVVLYVHALDGARAVEHARAGAMAGLTGCSAALVAGLSRWRTRAAGWISAGTLALTALLVQVPALSRLLHMEPLHLGDWLLVLAGSVAAALVPALLGSRRTHA